VLVEIILLSFRSAGGHAANGRMGVAHVLTKLGRERGYDCDGLLRRLHYERSGSKTFRPIMAMLGLMPVTECGVMRYAANSAGRRSGHDSDCTSIEARNI